MKNIYIIVFLIFLFSNLSWSQNEKINLTIANIQQSSTEGNAKPDLSVDGIFTDVSSSMTLPGLNSAWTANLGCNKTINKIKITTNISSDLYVVFSKKNINYFSNFSTDTYGDYKFTETTDLVKALGDNKNHYVFIKNSLLNREIKIEENYAQYVSIFTSSYSSNELIEVEMWGIDDCINTVDGWNVFNETDTEICDDGIDNDDDGNIDCDDWDCMVRSAIINYEEPSCPVCNDGEICIDVNNVAKISFDGGTTWESFDDTNKNCYTVGPSIAEIILKSPGGCILTETIDLTVPEGESLSDCVNGDFETGTFEGYTFGTGLNQNDPDGPHTFTSTDRDNTVHNIVNMNNFSDPHVGNLINNPGSSLGNYAFRLGDDNVIGSTNNDISQHELLSYCFTVDSGNSEFGFSYARVTNDPSDNHIDNDLPYFYWEIVDSDGNIITSQVELSNNPFYQTWGQITIDGWNFIDIRYKGWDCVYYDLSSHIGEEVCVNFVNSDCGVWAHWAYTYIDNICSPAGVEALGKIEDKCGNELTALCKGQELNLISEPGGYLFYNWEISKIDENGNKYDTYISPQIIGVQAELDDLISYYESNSGFEAECGVDLSVVLNVGNTCSENSDEVILEYKCTDHNINYCNPIIYCSNSAPLQIIGESDCTDCTYRWEPANRILNNGTAFPQINNADYFDALGLTYTYNITSSEGCNYCGEVEVKRQGFDLELKNFDLGHCSYNYELSVILSEPLEGISNNDIQVTITNIVNNEETIIIPTGSGLTRKIYQEYLRTSDTRFRVTVELNPSSCNDGESCRKSYTFDRINKVSYHAYWKAEWPNAFSPNGDGDNDVWNWTIRSLDLENPNCLQVDPDKTSVYYLEYEIFDRWGNYMGGIQTDLSLFDTRGLRGDELIWDGTLNGQPVAAGVYVIEITTKTCFDDPTFDCDDCGESTDPFSYCFNKNNDKVNIIYHANDNHLIQTVDGVTVVR